MNKNTYENRKSSEYEMNDRVVEQTTTTTTTTAAK
jgi:hypothetical protein